MKSVEAQAFLRELGSDVKRVQADKIVASCPLAPWLHSGGTDKSPSFALLKGRQGFSSYHCFTCGSSGTARGLLWEWMKRGRRTSTLACSYVYDPLGGKAQEAEEDVRRLEYNPGGRSVSVGRRELSCDRSFLVGSQSSLNGAGMESRRRKPEYKPPKEDALKRLLPAYASEYVRGRVSAKACDHWGLRYSERERRWVFPVRDINKKLVGWTARSTWGEPWCYRCGLKFDEGTPGLCPRCFTPLMKYKHWSGRWRSQNVYGIEHCVKGEPVVITEGTTDAINLWELGVRHPVAILGSNPNPEQLQLIAAVASKVYLMGDGDEAGRKLNAKAGAMLEALGVETQAVELDEGQDPGDIFEGSEVFSQLPIPPKAL